MGGLNSTPPVNVDRIESWSGVLRAGSTRERLAVVREMADKLLPSEANAVLKLYPEEGDRVRWGLMRVLGELKIEFVPSLREMLFPDFLQCISNGNAHSMPSPTV